MPTWLLQLRQNLLRWWARNRSWRLAWDRPFKLLAVMGVVAATAIVLERLLLADDLRWLRDWVKGSAIFGELLFPDAAKEIEWKDRLQGIVLLLGLPVAFCLWHWRDKNVRDQIQEQRKQVENQRNDTNLKEFQEVQLRAAGALDEGLPQPARDQLQIAALHQLRGFLRGDYGESFRRPAFELLLAGHGEAVRRSNIFQQLEDLKEQTDFACNGAYPEVFESLKGSWTKIDLERAGIISDEWRSIFKSGFPLVGRHFDGLDLSGLPLENCQFQNSTFVACNLRTTEFQFANIGHCQFDGSECEDATFEFAEAENTSFFASWLRGADFAGADLRFASFRIAHAPEANLCDANLRLAKIDSANLDGATFSDGTVHSRGPQALFDDDAGRDLETLVKRGARHVVAR